MISTEAGKIPIASRVEMTKSQKWQRIPTRLSFEHFQQFVLPHLSTGSRGPAPKLPLHRVFNLIETNQAANVLAKIDAQNRNLRHVSAPLPDSANRAGNGAGFIDGRCRHRIGHLGDQSGKHLSFSHQALFNRNPHRRIGGSGRTIPSLQTRVRKLKFIAALH